MRRPIPEHGTSLASPRGSLMPSARGEMSPTPFAVSSARGEMSPTSFAMSSERGEMPSASFAVSSERGEMSPVSFAVSSERGEMSPASIAVSSARGEMSPTSFAMSSERGRCLRGRLQCHRSGGDVSGAQGRRDGARALDHPVRRLIEVYPFRGGLEPVIAPCDLGPHDNDNHRTTRKAHRTQAPRAHRGVPATGGRGGGARIRVDACETEGDPRQATPGGSAAYPR